GRKASPTARAPSPRSRSETTPKTRRNGVALNGRIPAYPAARIAAATRSSGRRNFCARRASRNPPGVTPMPEGPMARLEHVPDAELHLPARREILDLPQPWELQPVDAAPRAGIVAHEAKQGRTHLTRCHAVL